MPWHFAFSAGNACLFFLTFFRGHADKHSLFSLWSFHLFTKYFALLNISAISLNHFFPRNKCGSLSDLFLFLSLESQNKIDILRKQKYYRTQKHLLWNKNLCLLRVLFLLKNKHHGPSENEEKPPADTFSCWLMMLSSHSRFRNGYQGTNGLRLIQ